MNSPAVTLIFPHQLFRHHPALHTGRPVCLCEETLFFHQYCFHRKKLLLHRASMKAYAQYLEEKGHSVRYIDATQKENDVRILIGELHQAGCREIHIADPVDDWLLRRVKKTCAALDIRVLISRTPCFLNSPEELAPFFDRRKTYFQTDFYIAQRRQRKILLAAGGLPAGGKWTYDTENRKPLPGKAVLPALVFPRDNAFVEEARHYVDKHFPENYGDTQPLPGGGFYPVTFDQADGWLDEFLEDRLVAFGPYEDAMRGREHFIFHAVLTPLLNTGLLEPECVLAKTLSIAARKEIPLPSLEGFLRQLIGWREFVRIVYVREGRRQRLKNFWGFSRKIPETFWTGQTGIDPVDTVIGKVLRTGYAHHIERLMVLGSFLLLCEFDPDEVYRWFTELFIDAYDWVMVPNVYGMTQFADGGLMTTKPYISGSNYLLKMGDWKKGPWQATWDGLFWRFLHVHRDVFSRNPRWKMLITTWDKMPAPKKELHLARAEKFLAGLAASKNRRSNVKQGP